VWHPHRLQSQPQDLLELGDGGLRIIERQQGDAHETCILGTELRHRAVVSARCAVALFERSLLAERQAFREGCKYQLACEAQNIEGLRAFVAIEGTERIVAFGSGQQPVAQRQ
jgi:hypothetical protein